MRAKTLDCSGPTEWTRAANRPLHGIIKGGHEKMDQVRRYGGGEKSVTKRSAVSVHARLARGGRALALRGNSHKPCSSVRPPTCDACETHGQLSGAMAADKSQGIISWLEGKGAVVCLWVGERKRRTQACTCHGGAVTSQSCLVRVHALIHIHT